MTLIASAVAAIVVAASSSWSAPTLDSSALTEAGGGLSASTLELSFSEGQAVSGKGQTGSLLLDVGFLSAPDPNSDVQPPRTTLTLGTPAFSSNTLFVTSLTTASLSVVDDRTTVGDGLGLGIARSYVAVDTGSFTANTGAFTLVGEGVHTIRFFSTDLAGNQEIVQSRSLTVDDSAPLTRLLVNGASASTTTLVLISTDVLSLTALDLGSGVSATLFSLDGAPFQVYVAAFTLDAGTHTLVYQSRDNVSNLERASVVTLSVHGPDAIPPNLSIVPVSGSTVTNSAPAIVASYSDSGTGVNAASVRLDLDGVDVTTHAVVSASSATFVPAASLGQGTHTVTAAVADKAGNASAATATFLIDSLAPSTILYVDSTAMSGSSISIVSTSTLSLAATDTGTGVSRIAYSIDGAAAQVFQQAFTLAAGTHTITFQSTDNAGNIEPVESRLITVSGVNVSVSVSFDPGTINLKSEGKFETASIRSFGLRSAADIQLATIRITSVDERPLNSPISVVSKPPPQLGVVDGIQALILKFDRQALIAVLPPQEQAKIGVEGAFKDGSPFVTYGFVTTINPGRVKRGDSAKINHLATGANVTLPAGALTQDADITVVKVAAVPAAEQAQRDDAAAAKQLKANGAAFQFGPEGTQFALPVTLTLPYDAAALAGADPRTLKVAYWNPQSAAWELLESSVDTSVRTVTARTPHFSLYQVVQPQGITGPGNGGTTGSAGIAPASGADSAFRFVDFYLFPNPSRGGRHPTVRAQVGLADSIEVRIYDVSGSLVHSGSSTSPQVLDDGQGKGPQYTFDYSWDTASVGSGVYLVAITAKKGGQADIKRIKKVAVLK